MPEYKRSLQPPERSFFLFGPRGSGKSSYLRKHYPTALWIDLLEESRYQSYLVNPGLFAEDIEVASKDRWVVVDEVQRIPGLLNEVHRLIEKDQRKFALCGSSARQLRRAGVNLLAGRAIRRFMHPLTPFELKKDFKLELVLAYGSLPLIWQSEDKQESLKGYSQMYLKEEIQAEAIVRNLPAFLRFLPVAALLHSQVISVSSLARDAEAHRTTINGYLEILEDTLLAFRVPAFESKLKIREKKHPKLYFADNGIVRALKKSLGKVYPEERGALFEGWIAQLLRSQRDYCDLFDEMYYWAASKSGAEVDFILEKKGKIVAIEAKSSHRLHKADFEGLRAIAKVKSLNRRIVVYCGTETRKTEDGIDIFPVNSFLKELQKGLW